MWLEKHTISDHLWSACVTNGPELRSAAAQQSIRSSGYSGPRRRDCNSRQRRPCAIAAFVMTAALSAAPQSSCLPPAPVSPALAARSPCHWSPCRAAKLRWTFLSARPLSLRETGTLSCPSLPAPGIGIGIVCSWPSSAAPAALGGLAAADFPSTWDWFAFSWVPPPPWLMPTTAWLAVTLTC